MNALDMNLAPDVDTWPEPPDEAAYHGLAGDLVHAVAEVTEADPVALLGTTLALFGVAVGPGCATYQGGQQRPNLYVCLVGDTSSGRKGTSWRVAREPFTQAYPQVDQLLVPGLGSGEGLIRCLMPTEEHPIVDPRKLVLEEEFGRFLTAMTREGNTLSPVFRTGWDGSPMGRFLARESGLVLNHHVGAICHATAIELRDKLRDTDAANGFGNRFLWLSVRRTRLIPFTSNPAPLVTPYIEALHRAITEAQTPRELPLTGAARDRWETLYAEIAMRKRWGLVEALTARAEAQIVRLALVYAPLDRSRVVDLAHLEAGIALEDFSQRSILYIFGDSTGNADADEMRHILADFPDGIGRNELRGETGIRDAARLAKAVNVLVNLGLATVSKEGTRAGRKGGPHAEIIHSTEATDG